MFDIDAMAVVLMPSIFLRSYDRRAILRLKNFPRQFSMMRGVSRPLLMRAREDGTEEEIKEGDLYRYTRYRWLNDESDKLAARYREFNLQALIEKAIEVSSVGSKSCVKVVKCVEGQFNKVFILMMDDGSEVVAKIPNPNAGPAFFTTASEVATRDFLRNVLGVPNPRIYAWSSNVSNAVGAEYILEEKAKGESLARHWYKWKKQWQLDTIRQIVELESKLGSVMFSKHGSLYYGSDLVSKDSPCVPLPQDITQVTAGVDLDISALAKFSIGPITQAVVWHSERAAMDVDKGPWTHPIDYITALGDNELRWAERYAVPRKNYARSFGQPELPDEYISLLRRYHLLAPYLAPSTLEGKNFKTLSHPDLHLDNVFIDPCTRKITQIIDWQSASISEVFFQRGFPRMLEPLPTRQESLCEKKQEEVDGDKSPTTNSEDLDNLSYYTECVKTLDPVRFAILSETHRSVRLKPVSLVVGSWIREDSFSLRHALIGVIARWKDLVPEGTACPIDFSKDELESHQTEMHNLEVLSEIMHALQETNSIPVGGMVPPDYFDAARSVSEHYKQMFIELAQDDEEKELHTGMWPYQHS